MSIETVVIRRPHPPVFAAECDAVSALFLASRRAALPQLREVHSDAAELTAEPAAEPTTEPLPEPLASLTVSLYFARPTGPATFHAQAFALH